MDGSRLMLRVVERCMIDEVVGLGAVLLSLLQRPSNVSHGRACVCAFFVRVCLRLCVLAVGSELAFRSSAFSASGNGLSVFAVEALNVTAIGQVQRHRIPAQVLVSGP